MRARKQPSGGAGKFPGAEAPPTHRRGVKLLIPASPAPTPQNIPGWRTVGRVGPWDLHSSWHLLYELLRAAAAKDNKSCGLNQRTSITFLSGRQMPNMGLTGLRSRCRQSCIFSGCSGKESMSLLFPAPRDHLCSWPVTPPPSAKPVTLTLSLSCRHLSGAPSRESSQFVRILQFRPSRVGMDV